MKYQASLVPKLIYVFRINDPAHKGCLKVGEATVDSEEPIFNLPPNCSTLNKAAKKRINQYTQTAGITYELLHTELTIYMSGKAICSFNDKAVHDVLKRSGIKQKCFNPDAKADEWFVTDLETVKRAIAATRDGRSSLNQSEITTDRSPIEFRPEQQEAIKRTSKRFKKNKRMLWNAKMRFGKTLTALQVVKEMGYTRTLILTHRPVVNDGWYDDFKKIFYDRSDFSYGSKVSGDTFNTLEKAVKKSGGHYVYFASMQDLRGSERTGGKFDKNNEIFDTPWDLVIVDEAHEGTQTKLGQNVLTELNKTETRILQLSGTPFNLLEDCEEDEIYTWDYVMEQRAKAEWDKLHHGDPNPYAALPRLNIYTFDLGEKFAEFKDSELAFNFHEFFRVDETSEFVHRKPVKAFLDLICRQSEDSNYPYSTEEYRRNFRHSFWRIPGVKEGKALSAMLKAHPVFGQFEIVNVAGDGDDDEKSEEALKMVRAAIKKSEYTITLSCGRLTTGVTVPEWTAVFMLAGSFSTSASSYMQTIFRAQSPATINGKVKEECFVFDFAPDRTLKVLAETAKISAKAGKTSGTDRQQMGKFLNFCPVISCQGTIMTEYDADRMLGQLKKVYVERVVQGGFDNNYLYNNDLMHKLTGEDISAFDDLKKIIGSTKAMAKTKDIDVNAQGFRDEKHEDNSEKKKRKKEESEAEKAAREERERKKKQRDAAISILRGISIRMPLMIYGAELKDESQEITIDNFADLIDEKSWLEFMPRGVTKARFAEFKKYYEADVFRESGRRIREMAKAADALPLEERIERITTIFSYFRNPDKETVLTPWRVVNIHLNDCLGGYTFFDEKFETPLPSPRFVNRGEATASVFAPTSRVLEINSKSGLYPLYVAYSIYRSRFHSKADTSVAEQHAEWDKVLAENIFVICKTPMAKSITRRTLGGFRKCRINAHCFEDLVNMLRFKSEQFVRKVGRTSYWNIQGGDNDMKFSAVVGNPPYQISAGETGGKDNPIYHYFMDAAYLLAPRVALITPGRFLFDAGQTPKVWNRKMLDDRHLKVVHYWQKSNEVFPNVDIKGGVAITYRDENADFGAIEMFTIYPVLNSIFHKVVAKEASAPMLDSIISSRGHYRFSAKAFEDHPEIPNVLGTGTGNMIASNAFQLLPQIFLTDKPNNGQYIELIGRLNNERVSRFMLKKYLEKNNYLDCYNVLVPEANGTGAIGEVLSTPMIGEPMIGSTDTFISVGRFSASVEAENCMKYIKSKFCRVMLGVLKITQHNPKSTWRYVPLPDFTGDSDIDWSKLIPEIDQQLYKKYGLSPEEIAFIETNIKPME